MKAPKPTTTPTPARLDHPPRRRHYAFTVEPVKGGWKVDHVTEFPARGDADHYSLTLLGRYGGDASSITLERELVNGEVLEAALLKR